MAKHAMVFTWKVKPGRYADFMTQQSEWGSQMSSGPGAPSYTVWSTVGGPGEEPSTVVTVVLEFANSVAYGEYMDATMSDPKNMIGLMESGFSADAPAIQLSAANVAEIPIG